METFHERSKRIHLRLQQLRRVNLHMRLPEACRANGVRVRHQVRLWRCLRLREEHGRRIVMVRSVVEARALLVSAPVSCSAAVIVMWRENYRLVAATPTPL